MKCPKCSCPRIKYTDQDIIERKKYNKRSWTKSYKVQIRKDKDKREHNKVKCPNCNWEGRW